MIPKPLLGSLDTLTIKGYFFVDKIVNLLVKGSWEKSKYGYALVVNEFKEIIPPTKEGIIAYLSATVNGIKESMAKKIVGQFGLQTLEVFQVCQNREGVWGRGNECFAQRTVPTLRNRGLRFPDCRSDCVKDDVYADRPYAYLRSSRGSQSGSTPTRS